MPLSPDPLPVPCGAREKISGGCSKMRPRPGAVGARAVAAAFCFIARRLLIDRSRGCVCFLPRIIQNLPERRQEQLHVRLARRLAHPTDPPDFPLERAKAGA